MNSTSSIITIGREYGSGGRQIGQEVAKYFGIKCYDKELLEHAANESGICKELFENHDERPTNSFLYSLVMDTYSFGYSSSGFTDMPMNTKYFLHSLTQSRNWPPKVHALWSEDVQIMRCQSIKTVSVYLYMQIQTGGLTVFHRNIIKLQKKQKT